MTTFEAAARLGSFTRAAEELNVSQPTVSHHVQTLEAAIGAELFSRHHNRIALTRAGRALADAVALGLGHIEQAARQIALRPSGSGLVLACSMGFTHGWLLPRFSRLRLALSDYPIHLVTTDWHQGFDRETADIIVDWQSVGRASRTTIPLFPEIVFPVCSAGYLNEHPELATADAQPRALLGCTLLHFDERDSEFANWEKWFAAQGVVYGIPPNAYRFSNYDLILRAVADGEGLGLGWLHLIEERLAAGSLVRVGRTLCNEMTAYGLDVRHGTVPDDVLERAVAWFRSEAGAPGQEF
ncbi:LysR family transcriptional regulator [Defluviimonas sp. CAU 1641]|uniref:LysR family transcriptional regulator n=1 Tax=Defluviimonas salinarum TaxID=2992147 RepID=A0ABT3J342_9RHOB|nr:LysR family transcriptional regulator [Defluviimonas salinarum]